MKLHDLLINVILTNRVKIKNNRDDLKTIAKGEVRHILHSRPNYCDIKDAEIDYIEVKKHKMIIVLQEKEIIVDE